MTNLIVGKDILSRGLLRGAKEENLKNSTYDLTIGDIFAVGRTNVKMRRSKGGPDRYFIEPRERGLLPDGAKSYAKPIKRAFRGP